MSVVEDTVPSWSTPLTFRLEEVSRPNDTVCRCGTRVPGGKPRLEVKVAARTLVEVFRGAAFCSIVCLRAFVREGIEMLDASLDGHSQEICSDLRELVMDLEEVWASLERSHPGAGGYSHPTGSGGRRPTGELFEPELPFG
jgi:hypothetical protein